MLFNNIRDKRGQELFVGDYVVLEMVTRTPPVKEQIVKRIVSVSSASGTTGTSASGTEFHIMSLTDGFIRWNNEVTKISREEALVWIMDNGK